MADITLEQFEAEATSFLDSNASLKAEEKKFVWGEGSDKVTLFDEKARTNELEDEFAALSDEEACAGVEDAVFGERERFVSEHGAGDAQFGDESARVVGVAAGCGERRIVLGIPGTRCT